MSAAERAAARRDTLLVALACLACGVVSGTGYSLVAPPLAPYRPFPLAFWPFVALTFCCVVLLGVGIGHHRPRATIAVALLIPLLGAALFALVVALPVFTAFGAQMSGLTNYALTQAAVAYFTILFVTFPAAIAGLLGSYWWHEL